MAGICSNRQHRLCLSILALLLITQAVALQGAPQHEQSKGSHQQQNTLTLYTPHEQEPMETAIKEFQETTGILVNLVQGGTGELLGRIRKESDQAFPSCDVFWGGGAESIAANADLFEPCPSVHPRSIPLAYLGPDKLWISESPAPVVIIHNTILVEPGQVPKGWADLLDPAWKGKIAFANPAKSGSAYTLLCTMITAMGGPEHGGWDFIERLVENLDGKLLDNSSDAYSLVAQGEFYIGLTQEKSASTAIGSGATIAISYPVEGTSAMPDAIAIVKDCPNRDLALRFIEFILGLDNQHIMSVLFNRRPVRTDLPPPEGLPSMDAIRLVDYDLAWAATSKATILSKWGGIVAGR